MNKFLLRIFFGVLLFGAMLSGNRALATHIYGADLGYTYVSANTYKITLTLYANCAGASFPSLNGSSATVLVYNGATTVATLTLPQESLPVEVTPVCASQANLTACFNASSTIPGVKRFIYSTTYIVPSVSANWRFRFNGDAGGATGRSTNITNIVSGTTMSLEATLNNTLGPNSSPAYTTIPTPFFCINKPAAYNPGTVDADGDLLSFALVPGILPTSGTVTYLVPYTATAPLASTTGTFSFSNTNGQLGFTPSVTQKSLVVSQVSEYRGSTLVGTSMREMTFVVLPCSNNPPGGDITIPSAGVTLINANSVSVCKERGPFSFKIDPADLDGDTINVSVSGLPAGATLNVTGNNTVTPTSIFNWDASLVAPGIYTFFVTYTDDGCPLASKQTIAYTVTVLPNPALTYSLISAANCVAKAVFALTPVNAPGPYTISFGTTTRSSVPGAVTDSLNPGTYTFSITAANGCSHDTSITIAPPLLTKVSTVVKQNTCNGTTNGSVAINANSGNAPYTFAMGAGAYSASNTFSNLAAGSYIFHTKDQIGCIKDTTIVLNDSLKVYGTIAVTDVLCNGALTGALQVAGTGGVAPYSFALNAAPFTTGGNFPGLAAGTYAVHIKDMLGCFKDTSAAIIQPTKLTIAASVVNVTCNGLTNGAVTMSAAGGTPPYTYAIGAGSYGSAPIYSGLAAGTYTFHVQDNHGCQVDTFTVLITQPAPLAFTLAVANVLCNGGTTGSVTITASGGTPAYSYAAGANPFGSANLLAGFNAGAKAIHLKDANGCIKDTSVTITEPTLLKIGYTLTDPSCYGSTNGTITITGSGGITPYAYALNAAPFTGSGAMSSLAPGTYNVHIKDANGCTHDTIATLTEPPVITVQTAIRRPRCTPLVNGIVTLIAGGGVPGYTYARGSGAYGASPVFSNLGSGTYTFHIKDARNCIKDTTLTLTDSVAVHAVTAITNAKCFGSADGTIAITPSGGDVPYTFAVNATPYSATNPVVNLGAGSYILHVKDSNGCVLDTAQVITQPTIVVPGVSIAQPLCYLAANGIIALSAAGGTPGYTYANGLGTYSASGNFTGLTAGAYTLHVKDVNGCIRDTTVTVGQPTKLLFTSIFVSHNFCHGDSSGIITVNGTGATPPYAYASDAAIFSANNVLTPLKAGIRTIHMKDANGCTNDTAIQLNEPAKVNVLVDSVLNPTCEGYKDGMVRIAATGGIPSYTYSMDNATYSIQRQFNSLPEGAYVFYAKDTFGCVADTAVTLNGYPHIDINGAIVSNVRCYGDSNGHFDLQVSGGNPTFSYFMRLPADTNTTGHFDSLAKGAYTIHIVDGKGCFKDTTVNISQPDSLISSATFTPNDCISYDDGGSVTVTVTGGTVPYSYAWSGLPGQTSDKLTGMPNGNYVVMITDANLCRDTVGAVVGYDNCCKPYIVNAFTPNGDGRNDRFHVLFKGDIKLEDFSIYNRFGQRVFYSTAPTDSWDGTWNDLPQDAATYFYYIRLICGNKGDNIQEYKGDVTLIR